MTCTPVLALASVLLCAITSAAAPDDDLPPSHSVKPELYATGFAHAEGPALDHTGNLYVANYRGIGQIGRIGADGTASIFCDLNKLAPVEGRKPQAYGMKIDSEGRLIVADVGGGRVLRVSLDGTTVEVLAERFEGERFKAVNDVALDRQGNIYFSDSGQITTENTTGAIYRYDINTKQITLLAKELTLPNGLGITPDQKHLVVAETQTNRLLIFDLSTTGKAENQRVLCEFPSQTQGKVIGAKLGPDGLTFDKHGRVYVAMWLAGVVNVVDITTGKLLRQYDAGGLKATNVHFHGPYLYVTIAAKEAVYRLKLGVEGFEYAR